MLEPDKLLEMCDSLSSLVKRCPFYFDEQAASAMADITGVRMHIAGRASKPLKAWQVLVSSSSLPVSWASSLVRHPPKQDIPAMARLHQQIDKHTPRNMAIDAASPPARGPFGTPCRSSADTPYQYSRQLRLPGV